MTDTAIQTQGLGYRQGGNVILEDVGMSLPAGAFLAVVGPNGSGKTSLIKALLGTLRDATGTVRIFDVPPAQVPAAWIGYVPQIKTLDRSFPALAEELVVTGLRSRWPWRLRAADRDMARTALEAVGAAHLAERPVAALSGGELQRIYLARCMVRKPRLVLLDEPATGIDLRAESDMYGILEHYQKDTGATVVMVTHDLAAAHHHADSVLLLNRRVIRFGPPCDALTDEALREAFGHMGHHHDMNFPGHSHA